MSKISLYLPQPSADTLSSPECLQAELDLIPYIAYKLYSQYRLQSNFSDIESKIPSDFIQLMATVMEEAQDAHS